MTLLPPNASTLEKGIEAAVTASQLPVPLRALWSPQACPPALLPWLAWGLSIDSWDAQWPETVQRAVVANAIAVQRRKGTVDAVRRAVANYGGSMSLREWWQTAPRGIAHTFSLILSVSGTGSGSISAEYIDAVIAEVARVKPARSHFTFTLALESAGNVGLIPVARAAVYARLPCSAALPPVVDPVPANTLSLGGEPLTFDGQFLTFGA